MEIPKHSVWLAIITYYLRNILCTDLPPVAIIDSFIDEDAFLWKKAFKLISCERFGWPLLNQKMYRYYYLRRRFVWRVTHAWPAPIYSPALRTTIGLKSHVENIIPDKRFGQWMWCLICPASFLFLLVLTSSPFNCYFCSAFWPVFENPHL